MTDTNRPTGQNGFRGMRVLDQDGSTEELQGFDAFELTLGDKLRGERATMGKSLEDISDELKIRVELLQAIEDCNVDGFPSPSFIAGNVRSYAAYLGLDPEPCFEQFCACLLYTSPSPRDS